ncbi:MAG TPA: 50S ribosomal protein L29 [Anaerolineales bacterium]|uniref:Large ribosomal subunit protein uL29 n=1 Tax=uncultured Chloroflexi bacterium Rifle_16ft_4_minimus_6153 TaxID=1665079 RepID=A0A0H4T9G6_9CHLR|nr:50S ribosomal protein L29, large subunit ribosomal protein L29 [uncultured Chloroflexi bacterium Rifle_16ft_4_minimus_6153]HLE30608.1 50S ribosomal protein L29 [Anaerolineales bacterium]
MNISEIRALATPEVESKLDDAREELFKLRFQFSTGQLKDYSRLRATRRLIARLATALRERQLAAEMAAEEK